MADKTFKQYSEQTAPTGSDLIIIQQASDDTYKKVQLSNSNPAGAVLPNSLVSGTGTSWAWQSWTPSYTNFTAGNGTLNFAKYAQIGKTVHFRYSFTWGNTTALAGAFRLSLPVTANADYTIQDQIGWAEYFDDSTGTRAVGFARLNSTTELVGMYFLNSGGIITQAFINDSTTVPFNWTTNDKISISGTYEAA